MYKQKQLNEFRGQKGCLCTFALQKSTLRKERKTINNNRIYTSNAILFDLNIEAYIFKNPKYKWDDAFIK